MKETLMAAGRRSIASEEAFWEILVAAISPLTHVVDAVTRKLLLCLDIPCSVFTGIPVRLLMLLFTEQGVSTINTAAANTRSCRR